MSKARDLANAGTALGAVTATELAYVDGVTSAIQTQIDGKQAVVSGVDSTEIGYLNGVTSAIQTQIDAQIPKSIVTTKGDILAATGSGTIVRQGIGTNGHVLTADSAEADGLKWAALPASGSMTLLSTTTLSGNSVTVSSISGSYNTLKIIIAGVTTAGSDARFRINPNGTTNITNTVYSAFTGSATNGGANNSGIIFPIDMNTTSQLNLVVEIERYANTSTWKPMRYGGGISSTNSLVGAGQIATNSAITSLVFLLETGAHTFSAGTVLIYGIN